MSQSSPPKPKRKRKARIQGLWPRGLSDEEAASYCGIGRTTFLAMVEAGEMPKPLRMRGRKVWDLKALDLQLDRQSGLAEASKRLGDLSWAE